MIILSEDGKYMALSIRDLKPILDNPSEIFNHALVNDSVKIYALEPKPKEILNMPNAEKAYFSPDNNYIAFDSLLDNKESRGVIKLSSEINLPNDTAYKITDNEAVRHIAFSADNTWVAALLSNATISLIDLTSGQKY